MPWDERLHSRCFVCVAVKNFRAKKPEPSRVEFCRKIIATRLDKA